MHRLVHREREVRIHDCDCLSVREERRGE
jgi:hypothetical protein